MARAERFFSNTVLISDKLSSFFLKKNIAKKKNHSKFLKNAFVGENEIRKPKKSSFYAFFFVLPKNYGNESQPTKHKKIKYPHFSWKKNIAKWICWTFCNIFLLEKLRLFFLTKGIMVEKILHAIAVFEPNLLEPIGVRVQAD